MLRIDPTVPFEPSKTTKGLWKFVRHQTYQVGAITLPGFFQLSHFPVALLAFFSAVALEIWGLVNLLHLGGIEVVHVIFLFLLDIVFALCAHLPLGGINLLRNELLYNSDNAFVDRTEAKIRSLKLLSRFFAVSIFFVAAGKIVLFLALQRGGFDGLTAGITVSYVIAATIHIVWTGYFIMALFAQVFLSLDRAKFRRSSESDLRVVAHRKILFDSKYKIRPLTVDGHELKKVPKQRDRYALHTWGMLMDRQLQSLCTAQDFEDAAMKIAQKGVMSQVQIMEQEPAALVHEIDTDDLDGPTKPHLVTNQQDGGSAGETEVRG